MAQPLFETVPNLTKTPQELFKERRLSSAEVAVLVSKAIRDMQPDREPTVRSEAIRSLIPMGAQANTALPHLAELLGENKFVYWVAQVLASIGEAAVPTVLQALQSPHVAIRFWILSHPMAPEIAPPELFDALAGMVRDHSACVRQAAVPNLIRYGQRAIPTLKAIFLKDGDPRSRANAIFALGALRPISQDVAELLVMALRDTHSDIRKAASAVMNNPDPPVDIFIEALTEANQDSDAEVREGIAASLANMVARTSNYRQRIVTVLRKLEQDPSEKVRYWARVGIVERLGLQAAKPDSSPTINEPGSVVVTMDQLAANSCPEVE